MRPLSFMRSFRASELLNDFLWLPSGDRPDSQFSAADARGLRRPTASDSRLYRSSKLVVLAQQLRGVPLRFSGVGRLLAHPPALHGQDRRSGSDGMAWGEQAPGAATVDDPRALVSWRLAGPALTNLRASRRRRTATSRTLRSHGAHGPLGRPGWRRHTGPFPPSAAGSR